MINLKIFEKFNGKLALLRFIWYICSAKQIMVVTISRGKRLSCSILIEHFLCPIIRHRRLPLRKINQSSRSEDHICLAAQMGAAFFI
nr:MAG TPA: hypothetical protein [Caudoviricetes sp.]